MSLSCIIRPERPSDEIGIRHVLQTAFPTIEESRLVDDLRQAGRLTISLVAVCNDEVVGGIAFSPVTVGKDRCGLGLAPLAVVPQRQRHGIGSALVRAGLEICRSRDADFVVVLGDPGYYRRFGFEPASQWRLSDEYGGGDAFQVIELQPGRIPMGGGVVRYAPEFGRFGSNDSPP